MKQLTELNPLVEVIGLIAYSHLKEENKQEIIEELNHLGLDGAQFYETNYELIDRYAADFEACHTVHPEEALLFREGSIECTYGILAALAENPRWLENIEEVSEKEILSVWSRLFTNALEGSSSEPDFSSLEGRIAFLENQSLSDSEKWNAMLLLNQPKYYTAAIVEMYKDNLQAFHFARHKNASAIDALLADFAAEGIAHEPFLSVLAEFPEIKEIGPTLILPLCEWGLLTKGFYGLLVNKAFNFRGIPEQALTALKSGLKLLGDKSKFEILSALRADGAMYNLEIAERLNLSPPTASHHMNLLLTEGFVTIEKTDGKVYYRFAPEKVREIIKLLEKHFLL